MAKRCQSYVFQADWYKNFTFCMTNDGWEICRQKIIFDIVIDDGLTKVMGIIMSQTRPRTSRIDNIRSPILKRQQAIQKLQIKT